MPKSFHRPGSYRLCIAIMAFACLVATASAQSPVDGDLGSELSATQSRLADRFDQLEVLAGRLAELSNATQPRRARLLRQLVAESRERDMPGRFSTIVAALQQERLGKASTLQNGLQSDLQTLLELLLQEDRDQQIDSERKRIRQYLAELKKLIQRQRGIKARTDGGDDAEALTSDQTKLADATGKLEQKIESHDGKPTKTLGQSTQPAKAGGKEPERSAADTPSPGESPESPAAEPASSEDEQPAAESLESGSPQPDSASDPAKSPGQGKSSDAQPSPNQDQSGSPSSDLDSPKNQSPAQRAQQRLEKAKQRMQQATEALGDGENEDAVKQQEQALRELEQAKAELERILRQLREEEMERTLLMLEARYRKMLDAQVAVYEQTKTLDTSSDSAPQHEVEIAASRLSRQEREIVREADRALVLLREDGTTVAFPEAIQQTRDDMQSVMNRLKSAKIGSITQGLEEDIIAALEETLSALRQAVKKARSEQGQPQQGEGKPEEQSLVDQLAELRMIRTLQERINRRTKRYGDIIGDQPTADPDLREALDELAIRQERVFQATRDLDMGRNR